MSQRKQSKLLFILTLLFVVSLIIVAILMYYTGKSRYDKQSQVPEEMGETSGEVILTVGNGYGAELRLEEESSFDASMYEETDNRYELSGRWFQKDIEGQSVWLTVTEGSMIYFKVSGATEVDINFIGLPGVPGLPGPPGSDGKVLFIRIS